MVGMPPCPGINNNHPQYALTRNKCNADLASARILFHLQKSIKPSFARPPSSRLDRSRRGKLCPIRIILRAEMKVLTAHQPSPTSSILVAFGASHRAVVAQSRLSIIAYLDGTSTSSASIYSCKGQFVVC
jgi:hypothetical protein